jgi:hypothetical protein
VVFKAQTSTPATAAWLGAPVTCPEIEPVLARAYEAVVLTTAARTARRIAIALPHGRP